jgi:hypothetical protein
MIVLIMAKLHMFEYFWIINLKCCYLKSSWQALYPQIGKISVFLEFLKLGNNFQKFQNPQLITILVG